MRSTDRIVVMIALLGSCLGALPAFGQAIPQAESRHETAALKGVQRIRFELTLGGSTDHLGRMEGIYEKAGLGKVQFSQMTDDAWAAIKKAGIQIVDNDTIRLGTPPRVVLSMDIEDKEKTGKYKYLVRIYMEEPVRLQRDAQTILRDAITWEGEMYTETVSDTGLPAMKIHALNMLTRFLDSYTRENGTSKKPAK